MRRTTGIVAALLLTATGCGSTPSSGAPSSASSPSVTETSLSEPTASPFMPTEAPPPPADPTTTDAPPPPLSGKTVVLDPGHNGANAANPAAINKQVPNGNGGTKACNTVGTSTGSGYPEHEFNWDVATRAAATLQAAGANVVLTRPDDTGIGPCVNDRAAVGNDAAADAVVSIHADGAAGSAHGFYCILTPLSPGGPGIADQSASLAAVVRDSLATGPMAVATYAGSNGVDPNRVDLAGLNLSTRPTTLCELGNMKSPVDSAIQESPDGRQALADGLAAGITAYLTG